MSSAVGNSGSAGGGGVGGSVCSNADEEGCYRPCQFQLNSFDSVPKLKSVIGRAHDVPIQAEELEAIQLALEDQLSWVTRRNMCLNSNLEELQNSSASNFQCSSSSQFPYLAQSPSSRAASVLKNNNPIQNLVVSPFKVDTAAAGNAASSANHSPSKGSSGIGGGGGSARKDTHSAASSVVSSAAFSSISPVESLTKAKSETPAQFWKYLDSTYCASITPEDVQKYLIALSRNYEDASIGPLFDVPEPGSMSMDEDSQNPSIDSCSLHNNNDLRSANGDSGIPCKKSKLSATNGKRASPKKNGKLFSNGDLSKSDPDICTIGPLTQLIISSLVNTAAVKSLQTDVKLSECDEIDRSNQELGDESFDWVKSRQDCRMENLLRKELKTFGLLDEGDESAGLESVRQASDHHHHSTTVGGDDLDTQTDTSYSSASTTSDTDRVLPALRVDCADEVLCALRAKQCELDEKVDENKQHLKQLFLNCQEKIKQQELEAKAEVLDAKLKEQYSKLLGCKSNRKQFSKRDQENSRRLLAEWRSVYTSLNLL